MEVPLKKIMGQIGKNLMKNLFNEIQDIKREMDEKLNQEMTKTKSYAESVRNAIPTEKNQTSLAPWKKLIMQN